MVYHHSNMAPVTKMNYSWKLQDTNSEEEDQHVNRRDKNIILENCIPMVLQFSHSAVSDSLQPHGLQHTRLPCPLPTLRVYSNSCPRSRWCHPNISSSVVPFSSSSATANIKCNPIPSQINTNHHLLETEVYSFTVQEARCSKSGFGNIDFFLETWRKKPFHASLLGSAQKSLVFLRL